MLRPAHADAVFGSVDPWLKALHFLPQRLLSILNPWLPMWWRWL
jgi:hypothetical protein